MRNVGAQGTTEYLLILAVILVIAAVAIFYATRAAGYPAVSAVLDVHDNNLVIKVETGEIPAGDWAVTLDSSPAGAALNSGYNNVKLAAPRVILITNAPSGTYEVTLKHVPSGHIYFSGGTAGTVTKD